MEDKNGTVSSSSFSSSTNGTNGHARPDAASSEEVQAPEWDGEGDHRYEPTWRPFPMQALPLTIRNYVLETARAVMVDPAMVALPALCAVASCIGNSRVIRIKSKWHEPAILFGCVIAEPSSGKTTAMRWAVKPISDWDSARMLEFQEAEEQYDIDFAEWDVLKDKDPGAVGPPPKKPIRRRAIVNSITVETHVGKLVENPRGLFVVRDELRAWFASFGQYAKSGSSADECYWLEVFMGHEYNYDRKSGDYKSVRIRNLTSSVFGTIQPRMWKRLSIEDMYDSGMMARILLAWPPAVAAEESESDYEFEPTPEIERAYNALITGLLNLDYEESLRPGWTPREMVFTEKAAELWKRWNKPIRKDRRNSEGEIAAMLGRMEAYCGRFALLFAVCDRVTRGSGEFVEEHHVASAIALYDWFREEAERVYAMADMSADDTLKLTILQKLQSLGGSITARDLWISNRRKWVSSDSAREKLYELAGLDKAGEPDPALEKKAILVLGKRGRFYLRTQGPAAGEELPLADSDDVTWGEFVAAYSDQFLRRGQDNSFVHGWRGRLKSYTLEELLQAVQDLATDGRRTNAKWTGLWPDNHCPFLVQHADRRRREKVIQGMTTTAPSSNGAPKRSGPTADPDFSSREFGDYWSKAKKVNPDLSIEQAQEEYLAAKKAGLGTRFSA